MYVDTVGFDVYMNKVLFEENTYRDNYASGNKGILTVRGVQLLELVGEKFYNNGDSHDEMLPLVGAFFKRINQYTYSSFFTESMKVQIFYLTDHYIYRE